MSDTTTPNYGFDLPAVGASQDTWGGKLNANWTLADSAIHGLASGYLPLTGGGTISGSLAVTGSMSAGGNLDVTGSVSGSYIQSNGNLGVAGNIETGSITVDDHVTAQGQISGNSFNSATGAFFVAGNPNLYLARNSGDGAWRFVDAGNINFTLDVAGNLTVRGSVHGTNVLLAGGLDVGDILRDLLARVADLEALRLG